MNRRSRVPKRIAWSCCATRGRTSDRFSCCIPIRELAIDRILDEAAAGAPVTSLEDEYGVTHRVWKISEPAVIARIQALMADKKLLIADGHHRYETALAFRNENPGPEGRRESDDDFREHAFAGSGDSGDASRAERNLGGARQQDPGSAGSLPSDELKQVFRSPGAGQDSHRAGALDRAKFALYERERKPGELDVKVLHEELLGRRARHQRGSGARAEAHRVRARIGCRLCQSSDGGAQIAFLLEPVTSGASGGRGVFGRRDAAEVHRLLSEAAQRSDDLQAGALSGIRRRTTNSSTGLAADQVLLDDALQHFGRGRVIPDAIGINHGDGAAARKCAGNWPWCDRRSRDPASSRIRPGAFSDSPRKRW